MNCDDTYQGRLYQHLECNHSLHAIMAPAGHPELRVVYVELIPNTWVMPPVVSKRCFYDTR